MGFKGSLSWTNQLDGLIILQKTTQAGISLKLTENHNNMDLDEPLAGQLQVHVLTGVTGGASVSSAAAVAAKCVPGLGAAATVLAVVWNTPGIAEDTAEVKTPGDWCPSRGALPGLRTCQRWHTCPG